MRLLAGVLAVAGIGLSCMSFVAHAATCVHPVTGKISFEDVCPIYGTPPPPRPKPPCLLTEAQLREAEREERRFVFIYPTEEKHRQVYRAKLDDIAARLRSPSRRFGEAIRERKAIEVELEFIPKRKPLPEALKRRVDANDAAFAALTDVLGAITNEIRGAEAAFRDDRRRFGWIWQAGAVPGTSACPPHVPQ